MTSLKDLNKAVKKAKDDKCTIVINFQNHEVEYAHRTWVVYEEGCGHG